ncbi:hypothetical protein GCM10023148_04490 [Actinokineospora soli]
MHGGMGPVVGRVVTVFAALLGLGIVLRLIAAILDPVLPAGLLAVLTAGWDMLVGIVMPALAPIVALLILGGLVWVFVGKRSR